MRRYIGLSQQRQGGLQFEVTNGSILAVGDDSSVKFWDVDYPDMIGSTDAGGGLTVNNSLYKFFLFFFLYNM